MREASLARYACGAESELKPEPMVEPDNLVLQILRETRAEMADMRAEIADVRSDMKSGFADVASDMINLDAKIDKTRKELSDQVVGLRRAVMEYHSSAIGHGLLFTEIEERVRKIEHHLNLTGH